MESYAIANCEATPGDPFYRRINDLVEAGVDWIQLRAKSLEDGELYTIGQRMRALIRKGQTRFVVNRRADVAVAVMADGVHLPADGIPIGAAREAGRLVVGRSCHSVAECRQAHAEGADYVLLGPVFETRSKPSPSRITLEQLKMAGETGIRVFAIGGMSRHHLGHLRGLKLAGIAGITLFMEDQPVGDIVRAVQAL